MLKNYNKNLRKGFALITCSVITITFIGLMVVGLQSLNSAKSAYISTQDISEIRDYRKAYAAAFTRYLTKVCNSKLSSGDTEVTLIDLNLALYNTDNFMSQQFSDFVSADIKSYDQNSNSELNSLPTTHAFADTFFSPIHGSVYESVDLENLNILTFDNPDINSGSPSISSPLHLLASGHPCSTLKGKRLCVILRVSATLEGREWGYSEFQVSFFQIPMSQFSRVTNGDLNLNSSLGKSYTYYDSNIFTGGSLDGDSNALEASGLLNGRGRAFVKGDIPVRVLEEFELDIKSNIPNYAKFSQYEYDDDDHNDDSEDEHNNDDGSEHNNDDSVDGYYLEQFKAFEASKFSKSSKSALNSKAKNELKLRKLMKNETAVKVVSGSMLKRREFLFGTDSIKNVSDWTPPPWNWRTKDGGESFGNPSTNWFEWRLEDHLFVSQNNLGLNSDVDLVPLGSNLNGNTQELKYRDFSYGRSLAAKADWLFKFVYSNVLEDKPIDDLHDEIFEASSDYVINPNYLVSGQAGTLYNNTLLYLPWPVGSRAISAYDAAIDLGISSRVESSNSISVYGFKKTEYGYVQGYTSTFTEDGNADNPIFSYTLIPGSEGYNNFNHDIVMIDIDLDRVIDPDLISTDNTDMSWYLRGVLESESGLSTITSELDDGERSYHLIFRITGDSFGGSSLNTNNLNTLKNISLSFSNPVILSDFNSGTPHDSVTLGVPHNNINGKVIPEIYMSLIRGADATTSFSGAVYADDFIPRSYFEYGGSREYDNFNVKYINPNNTSNMTNWRRFSLVDYGSSYTRVY